jgi:Ca2+-binding EF-hand superfamily protein
MAGNVAAQLRKEFEKIDTEKTGLIAVSELETLLRKLNPNFSDDELKLIFSRLKQTDGKVKFDEFLEVFAPASRSNANPQLAKKLSDEEMEAVKNMFSKFDKDGSGQIDLNELKGMCEALGKKLPQAQCEAAMKQLDKDGNMQCNFDEFLLWYTTTPNVGGYNHVALGFMKAKLAMEAGAQRIKKIAKRKIDSIDEFKVEGSVEVSPELTTSPKDAMSVTAQMRKGGESNPAMRISLKASANDADAAAEILAAVDDLWAAVKEAGAPPFNFTKSQDGAQMTFMIDGLPNVFEESDMQQALSFLQDAVMKLGGKFSLGSNFNDMLNNPKKPLLSHFKGGRAEYDVNIGLSALVSIFAKDGIPPEAEAALKVLAVIIPEIKIFYNEPNILALASKLKDIFKSDYDGPSKIQMLRLSLGGLADLRTFLYQQVIDSGAVDDKENWTNTEPDFLKFSGSFFKFLDVAAKGLKSIDSLVIDGIPGTTVEFELKFNQVNPFPLLKYLVGSYPKNPDDAKKNNEAMMKKNLSDEEVERLQTTFSEFDKDKSGKLDLKELKTMIEKLGGTLSDEEAQEAMEQLDKNGDGTCNFEEFKELWSSKPKLGGHNSFTLGFLKAKVNAGSMFSKGRKLVSTASGYVGMGESKEDTTVSFLTEFSPSAKEVPEKMSIAFEIEQVDTKPEGKVCARIKLNAKSDDAAKKAADLIKTQMIPPPMMEMAEAMGASLVVEAKGSLVEVCATPPDGMIEAQLAENEELQEAMKVLVPLVKALKNTNAKIVVGTDCDDILSKPDTPFTEIFLGYKFIGQLIMTAGGKKFVLDALPKKSKKEVQFLSELARLFAGADIRICGGYHEANLSKLLTLAPEEMRGYLTLEGQKQFASVMGGQALEMMPLDDLAPSLNSGFTMLDLLDAIDSVSIENFDLPVEFSQNGLPATVGASLKFNNVKPFKLWKYATEPLADKVKEKTGS